MVYCNLTANPTTPCWANPIPSTVAEPDPLKDLKELAYAIREALLAKKRGDKVAYMYPLTSNYFKFISLEIEYRIAKKTLFPHRKKLLLQKETALLLHNTINYQFDSRSTKWNSPLSMYNNAKHFLESSFLLSLEKEVASLDIIVQTIKQSIPDYKDLSFNLLVDKIEFLTSDYVNGN